MPQLNRPIKVNESKQVKQQEPANHDDLNLRGSLASVSFLGLFIIISWLGVWLLFMIR